jgi:hypothetical protein
MARNIGGVYGTDTPYRQHPSAAITLSSVLAIVRRIAGIYALEIAIAIRRPRIAVLRLRRAGNFIGTGSGDHWAFAVLIRRALRGLALSLSASDSGKDGDSESPNNLSHFASAVEISCCVGS